MKSGVETMHPEEFCVDQTTTFVLSSITHSQARILDVGCGAGAVAVKLQGHGHKVVAIDESPELVERANVAGVDARVAQWPAFMDKPYDVVLFARSLHHIHPLTEAIQQASRILTRSGVIIVEDFAWEEISPVTAEWFYGVSRLLNFSNVLDASEKSFSGKVIHEGGDFAFWQHNHDHDLHTVKSMWETLKIYFQPVFEANVPHLYRYLCSVFAEDRDGYTIVSEVFEQEKRMAQIGAINLIGRRFVGRKL